MGKWSTLAFLCGIFVVYTIDRALLGVLAIQIQETTGVSDVQFGFLNSAVFWTYALCVPFAGLVGDRFDRRKIIALAAIAWSAMTLCAGFANGFWSLLLLVSFAVTVPQTFYGPSVNALIASLHKETRTIALGCHQAAFYSGWFLSGFAVAGILTILGTWRAAYFIFGAVAEVWVAAAAFGLLRGAFDANQFTSVFDVVPVRYRATSTSRGVASSSCAARTCGSRTSRSSTRRAGTHESSAATA